MDQRLVIEIADDDLPWGGAWTYEVAPNGDGATLTITEHDFVDNIVLRGLVALLMDPVHSTSQFQTDLLAHRRC
ncbi:MAG: hypothetical protein JKY37_10080 [Nannocystaceae bacterium]|nr:hypothetical protein [Nannocystaceae bacterium]